MTNYSLPPLWTEGDPHPFEGRVFYGPDGVRITYTPYGGIGRTGATEDDAKAVIRFARQAPLPPTRDELRARLRALRVVQIRVDEFPQTRKPFTASAWTQTEPDDPDFQATGQTDREALANLLAEMEKKR
jgi:hypothetical protein